MKVLTFGEMLLRLSSDPTVKLPQTNQLFFYYGGAEANVAVSLAHLGIPTEYLTKVPDNNIGEGCKQYLLANQVSINHLLFGGARLGLYFVESGIANRASNVTYDRKYSSFSKVKVEEFNWDTILADVDLFHTTGITLALSQELRDITLHAMQAAKEKGIKVSFDFNYRAKLWSQIEAKNAFEQVLDYVDIAFCNHMDAIYLLGITQAEAGWEEEQQLNYYYQNIQKKYPSIRYLASTTRKVISSSKHLLQGNLFANGRLYRSSEYAIEPVVDRIGGGDAYAAGIIFSYLNQWQENKMVSFAIANAVLKHSIKGDGNVFKAEEVAQFMETVNQEISR
ncbi:sugar kinase [Gracilibacillus massiliensis]|uniref:sugar kinase n=1 Tax=Gracilibacillus massiliensis TaxID=1564956 RepID=UPI00071C46BD|nr:sugar kinase [Gracilibacillus massiliensis]